MPAFQMHLPLFLEAAVLDSVVSIADAWAMTDWQLTAPQGFSLYPPHLQKPAGQVALYQRTVPHHQPRQQWWELEKTPEPLRH